MKWYNVIVVLAGLAAIAPVVSGVFIIRNAPEFLRVFFVFICFTFFFDFLSFLVAFNGIRNEWMAELYMLIEFGFFARYLNWAGKQIVWPNWIVYSIIMVAILIWSYKYFTNADFNFFVLFLLVINIVQSYWAISVSSYLKTANTFYYFITWVLIARIICNVILLFAYGLNEKYYFNSQSPYLGYFRWGLNTIATLFINSVYAMAIIGKLPKFKSL